MTDTDHTSHDHERPFNLKVATEDGKVKPSYFRECNPDMSHTALAFAYAMRVGKLTR